MAASSASGERTPAIAAARVPSAKLSGLGGDGCVRKVEVNERAHGTTYTVRFRHGGRQTSETFTNRQHADTFAGILNVAGPADALAWLETQAATGTRSGPTFGQWFDKWVTDLTGVTDRTRADYRRLARNRYGSLDKLPLSMVTRGHVAAIINGMQADGASSKTIKNAVTPLATSMKAAVDEGLIERNPATRHRLPQTVGDDDAEPLFLTHDEFARLYAAVPARYQPFILLLAGTGLRWSEATALRIRDVDLAASTLRVTRAWKRIPGGFEIGPPKTAAGRRTVTLPAEVVAALTPLCDRPRDELLFVTPLSGRQYHHSNFYRRIWTPACEAAGLTRRPRIHDLRHTHASWLIRLGIRLEVIQDRLGHESILTTRGVYGHLLPDMQAEAAQAAQLALSDARPQPALGSAGELQER